jgi:hypothetical protein
MTQSSICYKLFFFSDNILYRLKVQPFSLDKFLLFFRKNLFYTREKTQFNAQHVLNEFKRYEFKLK